jgi:hypothetical protein
MAKSARFGFAIALLLTSTSLASAKFRATAGVHGKSAPPPGVHATVSRPTVPDPYFRLSDAYYGDADPYRGLFNFYALPPYSPGSAYGVVSPIGR